jgi:hypothetical protein
VLLLFPALAASLSLSLILASFDYNDRPARPPARLLDNEAIFFVVENEFSTALSCGLSRNASLFLFFFLLLSLTYEQIVDALLASVWLFWGF